MIKSIINCIKLKTKGEKKCKTNTAKNDIGGPGRIGNILPTRPINNNKKTIDIRIKSIIQKYKNLQLIN